MPYTQSSADGAQLHYIDYRPSRSRHEQAGRTLQDTSLVFLHGWPMSSRMFEHLMLVLCENHGYRCIAPDRRGFGKSEWSGVGDIEITYDTFAQDTLQILKAMDGLGKFAFVASSMGCGESILVYELLASQLPSAKCCGFVWLGPSLPHPIQSESNSKAPSGELWDSIAQGLRSDRPEFASISIGGVFGISHEIKMSEPALKWYLTLIMEANCLATERCIDIITQKDFTTNLEDISKQGQRVLMLHGSHDQGMPVEASSSIVQTLLPGSQLKLYEKAAHGLYWTHAEQVIQDILGFLANIKQE